MSEAPNGLAFGLSSHEPPDGIVHIAQESQAVWTRTSILYWQGVRPVGLQMPESMSLLIYNPMAQDYVPWLATDYELSEDASNLTITLREGVRWSDGETFDANDVAFTLNLVPSHLRLDTHGIGSY